MDCMRGACAGALNLALATALTLAGQAKADADYRIGPLDRLDITVFQIKDLTLEKVQVDAAGEIRMPLIGSVTARGRTATELSSDIAVRLAERYLQSPQVLVVVAEAVSQKVSVEGAVNEAGVFDLKGRTGLMEAVARAKGESRTANLRRVAIVRSVNGTPRSATFDLIAIRSGRARDPEVLAGDTVVVDGSAAKSLWRGVVETLPSLIVFSYL